MKYEKLFEKEKYALILRKESLDEYAVVHGLNEKTGEWNHTVNYWSFGKYSRLSQVEALQRALDCFRLKTEDAIEQEMESKRIANILINMSLDMDYSDYLENYQDSVENLATEINAIKIRCPELFTALEMIALKNDNMEDWAITREG